MDSPIRRPEEILAYRSLPRILASKPKALWSAGPTDSVLTAMRFMAEKNIGFLVVLDNGSLVGVLSERDCARWAALGDRPLGTTPVSEIMVRKVITVDLSHKFGDCLALMHRHGIRHLPVTDNGNVIAVLSIRDLLSEAVSHNAKVIAELERERLTMFTSSA